MASTDVNVILTETFDGMKIVRCHGTMSLPKRSAGIPGQLLFELGDGTSFELYEEGFTRAEYTPGSVWIEVGPFVLSSSSVGIGWMLRIRSRSSSARHIGGVSSRRCPILTSVQSSGHAG